VKAGNPILESYPEQCKTPDGRTFVNPVQTAPQAPASEPQEVTEQYVQSGCMVGGCSGEICEEANNEPTVSTCMYRAEYACYKSARCERQTDGKCGWTLSADSVACLETAGQSQEAPQDAIY